MGVALIYYDTKQPHGEDISAAAPLTLARWCLCLPVFQGKFMDSTTHQMIKITPVAIGELQKLGATGESFLRISVVPGGCSGMTYSAAIDNVLSDDDQVVYTDDTLRVVADVGSTMFLDGLEIDYSDDLIASGFRFKNPKAKKGCGCGSSFSV